mmetsp:Transcript_4496/g.16435  ORF Transcript_4496/g.16435 Transcript_4496/m.16435 type:complete len:250 (+) Transcript_4496:1635-2384(+)
MARGWSEGQREVRAPSLLAVAGLGPLPVASGEGEGGGLAGSLLGKEGPGQDRVLDGDAPHAKSRSIESLQLEPLLPLQLESQPQVPLRLFPGMRELTDGKVAGQDELDVEEREKVLAVVRGGDGAPGERVCARRHLEEHQLDRATAGAVLEEGPSLHGAGHALSPLLVCKALHVSLPRRVEGGGGLVVVGLVTVLVLLCESDRGVLPPVWFSIILRGPAFQLRGSFTIPLLPLLLGQPFSRRLHASGLL